MTAQSIRSRSSLLLLKATPGFALPFYPSDMPQTHHVINHVRRNFWKIFSKTNIIATLQLQLRVRAFEHSCYSFLLLPEFYPMVVLNPNNWHWVDKDTLPWTRQYFDERFADFQVPSDAQQLVVVVTGVNSVQGDSNVSQRKGKVICYFDLNLSFNVAVKTDEKGQEEVVSGTITVPEFMHDETDFEVQCSGLGEHEQLVRSEFVPQLVQQLLAYQTDLINEHSKDVQQEGSR